MSFLITDPDACADELSLKSRVEPNQYSCLQTHRPSPNSYVLNFQTRADIDWDSQAKSTYKIVSDYDRSSKFMICRYIIKSSDCAVYPHVHSPHITIMGDRQTTSAAVSSLEDRLGLVLALIDPDPTDSLHSAHVEGGDYGDSYSDLPHQVLMFQIYDSLLKSGYSPFVATDQLDGVVAKCIENKYLHVCAIKNATISHSGDGYLTIETSYYKINPFTPALLTELLHQEEEEALEQQQQLSDALPQGLLLWKSFIVPIAGVFVPTNEDIRVLSFAEYTPPVIRGSSARERQQELAAHRERELSIFLTASDVRNRRRGYNQYVPDSYSKARLFWELAYGVRLPQAPQAVVFARISINGIEQVVPIDCIARGTAQLPNRAAVTQSAIVDDLYVVLRSSGLFQSISSPIPTAMLSEQRLVAAAAAVSHNMRGTPATALVGATSSARFSTALSLRKGKTNACILPSPDSEHDGSDNPDDSLDGLFDEDCEPVAKKASVAKEALVATKATVAKKAPVAKKVPLAKEATAVDEALAVDEAPGVKDASAAKKASVAKEEAPVAKEEPVAKKATVATKATVAKKSSLAKKAPLAKETTAVDDAPVAKEEAPVVSVGGARKPKRGRGTG